MGFPGTILIEPNSYHAIPHCPISIMTSTTRDRRDPIKHFQVYIKQLLRKGHKIRNKIDFRSKELIHTHDKEHLTIRHALSVIAKSFVLLETTGHNHGKTVEFKYDHNSK